MAIVRIHQNTKETKHGHLFPEDVLINALIAEAFHTLALAEELGFEEIIPSNFFKEHQSRFTVERIEYYNPFDFVGKLWDVGVKSAGNVIDHIIYHKPELRRRELQNALAVQEIAKAKMENVERAYDFVKKPQNDGMPTEQAMQMMSQLLADQGATLSIEPPKESDRERTF